MRVLVTGASGFVGQALVPYLAARGHEVAVALRSTKNTPAGAARVWLHADLRQPVDWAPMLGGVEAVVHLAGIAHSIGVSRADYDRVNHQTSAELATASAKAGVGRFVYLSSIKAQTGSVAAHVVTEADPATPEDDYGVSKLAAERAVMRAALGFTIFRPVLVYGPGVKGNLRSLSRLASTRWPLPFGDFDNRRSLLSVENLSLAVHLALSNDLLLNETFVVADPDALSLAELVAALRKGGGRPARLLPFPTGTIRAMLKLLGKGALWDRLGGSLVVNPARLLAVGWRPPVETRNGLATLARSLGR